MNVLTEDKVDILDHNYSDLTVTVDINGCSDFTLQLHDDEIADKLDDLGYDMHKKKNGWVFVESEDDTQTRTGGTYSLDMWDVVYNMDKQFELFRLTALKKLKKIGLLLIAALTMMSCNIVDPPADPEKEEEVVCDCYDYIDKLFKYDRWGTNSLLRSDFIQGTFYCSAFDDFILHSDNRIEIIRYMYDNEGKNNTTYIDGREWSFREFFGRWELVEATPYNCVFNLIYKDDPDWLWNGARFGDRDMSAIVGDTHFDNLNRCYDELNPDGMFRIYSPLHSNWHDQYNAGPYQVLKISDLSCDYVQAGDNLYYTIEDL